MINHVCVTNWSSAADEEIAFAVEGLRAEVPAFCAAWGLPVPGVQFYSQELLLPASDAIIVSAVDDDGQAGTAGYHAVLAGLPLFLWEARYGHWVAFHELFETLANPLLNRWATAPDGRRWWVEACDATQADTYQVQVELFGARRSISAANWLRPAFFGLPNLDGAPGFDRLGLVGAPFTLRPGGYSQVMVDGRLEHLGAARPPKGITTSRVASLQDAWRSRPPAPAMPGIATAPR
jgi:hypothetical protein